MAGQLALCRRKSTRLNYQARWGKFRKWCRDFHHRSSEPTIPKIAEFFTFLFKLRRLLYRLSKATERCFRLCLSSVFRRFRRHLFSWTWCAPFRSQLLAHYIIRFHGIWTRFWSTCQAPLFEPLAEASFRNKTRKALFLLAMATAKRIGELQALSFLVSHRGDDLVLHYDPFFLAKTESVSKPLPRSVIVQSLADFVGDLPERVLCPVHAISCLSGAARSVEFTPSSLFVSPSDPKRTTSKNAMSFFLRQLITESRAVSSLVPQRTHDI